MTEKEKMQLAKKYLDYLARGFNPLNEEPVSNADIVRNERISRCLLYVSEVLGEVIEKGIGEDKNASYARNGKGKKSEFYLTEDERRQFAFSDTPLTSTEIAVGLSDLRDENIYKVLRGVTINEWLAGNGFLREERNANDKVYYVVTDEGKALGITTEKRLSQNNTVYFINKFTKEAQQFIIDNLDGIIEHNKVRNEMQKAKKSASKSDKGYIKSNNILDEVIADLHLAGATVSEIAETTDYSEEFITERMKHLNII